jgi:hypothetical protein
VKLAGLARGRMKAKHGSLVEALTGRFDDHHGALAAILLAQIDGLTAQIDQLTARMPSPAHRTPGEAAGPKAWSPSSNAPSVSTVRDPP